MAVAEFLLSERYAEDRAIVAERLNVALDIERVRAMERVERRAARLVPCALSPLPARCTFPPVRSARSDMPFRNLHTHDCGQKGGNCFARIATLDEGKMIRTEPNRNRSEAMRQAWARRKAAAA